MRRAVPWAAVSIVMLGLIWLLAPGGQLPLYDGVGFPDEPYRWVVPDGQTHTSPPTSYLGHVSLRGGTNPDDVQVQTAEQGPQAILWILRHGLSAPAPKVTATLRIQPVPPTIKPNGTLYSDVYRFSALTPAGAATLDHRVSPAAAIFLRGPSAITPEPVVQVLEGDHWTPVPQTQQIGRDVWGAYVTKFGDYALVLPAGTDATDPAPATASSASTPRQLTPPSTSTSTGFRTLLFSLGAFVLGPAVVIIVIRRARRPAVDSAPSKLGDVPRLPPRSPPHP